MVARDLAQRHIDGLNGVGRIDHLADVLWEGKERNDARPVGPPRLTDAGIERIPFRGPSVPD